MSHSLEFLKTIIPNPLFTKLKNFKGKVQLKKWEKEGKPIPPPHAVKQSIIREYRKKTGNNILIETGTFLGDMVEAQKLYFSKIISIELSVELYEKAKKRFKNNKHVEIIHGDSGKVLKNIMSQLNQPSIFWLDGHYSSGKTARGDKDCPIFEELSNVFSFEDLNHVILIDDARHFNGEGDYPTIKELVNFVKRKNSNYNYFVADDIIRFEKN
jgi:hypothetical protein